MARRKYTPEQIIGILRQVEVAVSNGRSTPQACREAGIVEQTYYRWRREYGGLKLGQAKRMKDLEKENARLRQVVAELSLEKQILILISISLRSTFLQLGEKNPAAIWGVYRTFAVF